MRVRYTVKSYKEASEIHTKTNCITFDGKGNIINEDKYLNKNNIIFQIYNKIKNETRDVEFYPV